MRSSLVCLVLGVCLAVVPAQAGAKTVWLCRPGVHPDPCVGDLTASIVDTAGNVAGEQVTPVAKKPAIDCFYVYPTVSGQSTINANLHLDPEETAVAQYQVQRFSQDCRVFAPMYRQLTLQGILHPGDITAKARAIAYDGVVAAWHEYLRTYNKGRGVVLIGHSQGSFVLKALVAKELDRSKAERKLLVSALLLGGNVLVAKGKDVGGDFKHVPACRRTTQTGCVVAYSMFNATPPANALFGRTTAKGKQVLCTNPAALRGGSARLHPYSFATPFPGLEGLAVSQFTGPYPQVQTPWFIPPGTYTAHCSSAGGANVLLVKAGHGGRDFPPSPDATWGWHLGDVSLGLGDLTALVRRQTTAWLRAARG